MIPSPPPSSPHLLPLTSPPPPLPFFLAMFPSLASCILFLSFQGFSLFVSTPALLSLLSLCLVSLFVNVVFSSPLLLSFTPCFSCRNYPSKFGPKTQFFLFPSNIVSPFTTMTFILLHPSSVVFPYLTTASSISSSQALPTTTPSPILVL